MNETKNSKENRVQVNTIENKWTNLVEAMKSIPTSDTKKIKNRNNKLEIVELIIYINGQNQQWKDFKILTPDQMLSRLPISLVQLKSGNNSEKLKNEIRQLLHSLYRSKKLTKQLYKNLVDII